MYITDKRKPHTVPFGSLNRGDVFAMDDADEHNKFYLMKTEIKKLLLLTTKKLIKEDKKKPGRKPRKTKKAEGEEKVNE